MFKAVCVTEYLKDPSNWKWVKGYEGLYEVSRWSHVRSYVRYPSGHILTPGQGGVGYRTVALKKDGKAKSHNLHQLVLEHWGPRKPSPLHIVAHNNGVKTDNRLHNLRWATRSENEADKLLHGIPRGGEHTWNAKLSDEAIEFAKRLRSQGLIWKEIAKILGVNRCTVSEAVRGVTWKHLKGE